MPTKHWAVMNDMIAEIDRLDSAILTASGHVNLNPNSILAQKIKEMEQARGIVMNRLDDHISAWTESLQKEAL